jgi:F-box protein 11
LIREYDVAKHWLEEAYKEGLAEYERSHTREELAQFKSEIMDPLDNLLKSYPSTSNSTVPLLAQFSRLETGSSSTSDNSSLAWVKKDRDEIKIRTVIVDSRRGDYSRISDAIKNVPEKTRILVRPGTYRESIVLTKNVEIVGDGPREQIVLLSNDADCIRVATDSVAVVRGMTIHGQAKDHYAIDIPRGRLHLSDCIVTCDTLACIGIHNSTAQPLIQHCIIRDGGASGIFVYDQGAGVIEDCDISNNKLSGVTVKGGGNPLMRRCEIHDGQASGIYVYENGKGTYEDCDIFANKNSGVAVREGGNPLVRRCEIHDGQTSGIHVYKNEKRT